MAEPELSPIGLAVIDKEAGWTSHDVVARARRQLGTKRVGHAGTLDPDATGVLVLGVGPVTRLLRFVTDLPKTYQAEIVLGTETTTLDAAGEVTATHDMSGVGLGDVEGAALRLTGAIHQVPPMVSAVSVGGVRLHKLARQGIEVEREPRAVVVHRFEVAATDDPLVFTAEVECSSGTYVRSLAADLGRALGGGAHLRALRRAAIGHFTLDAAGAIDALTPDHLAPPLAAVANLPKRPVTSAEAIDVAHGRPLHPFWERISAESAEIRSQNENWAVVDGDSGELLAVYEAPAGDPEAPWRAVVVLPTGDGSG